MFNLVFLDKVSTKALIVDDVVVLVCTCGFNEILKFGYWENKIEGEGGGGGTTVVVEPRDDNDYSSRVKEGTVMNVVVELKKGLTVLVIYDFLKDVYATILSIFLVFQNGQILLVL